MPEEDRNATEKARIHEFYVRTANHAEFMRQVSALVGDFNWTSTVGVYPRAVYLGFASGASVWDDAFYEPLVAEIARKNFVWKPGQARFIELDRQRPWRRTRRLRV